MKGQDSGEPNFYVGDTISEAARAIVEMTDEEVDALPEY